MQSSSHSVTAIPVVVLVASAETLSLRGVLCAWMRVWWADRGRADPRSEGIVCVYLYVILCVCLCVSVCVRVSVCVPYYCCSVKLWSNKSNKKLCNAGQWGEGNLELTYPVGVVYCCSLSWFSVCCEAIKQRCSMQSSSHSTTAILIVMLMA